MSKLRLVVAAVLAAATLGTAAVAVPSASAASPRCDKIWQQHQIYANVAALLEATGYGWSQAADEAYRNSAASVKAYVKCVVG